MALEKKAYVKDKAKENGFGEYSEDTGGGTPMGKGQKLSAGGRGTWEDNYDKKPHRVSGQPRTEDGKFTYNAVNGKPLKAISKVGGHSRGTTVSPLLTGGENGVHYFKDKKHNELVDNAKENARIYTGLSIQQLYDKGQKIAYKGKVAIAPRPFVESAQEVVPNKNIDWEEISYLAAPDRLDKIHFVDDQLSAPSWKKREMTDIEKAETGGSKETGLVLEGGDHIEKSPVVKKGDNEKTFFYIPLSEIDKIDDFDLGDFLDEHADDDAGSFIDEEGFKDLLDNGSKRMLIKELENNVILYDAMEEFILKDASNTKEAKERSKWDTEKQAEFLNGLDSKQLSEAFLYFKANALRIARDYGFKS